MVLVVLKKKYERAKLKVIGYEIIDILMAVPLGVPSDSH